MKVKFLEMARESGMWFACFVLVLIARERAVAAVSCGDAVAALIPCGGFLVGAGAEKPSNECCKSAQTLNDLTSSPASRKSVCECFKQSGPSFGVKPERAKLLPVLCKLTLHIPISPDVNCTNV